MDGNKPVEYVRGLGLRTELSAEEKNALQSTATEWLVSNGYGEVEGRRHLPRDCKGYGVVIADRSADATSLGQAYAQGGLLAMDGPPTSCGRAGAGCNALAPNAAQRERVRQNT
jgi:hypothetical protein